MKLNRLLLLAAIPILVVLLVAAYLSVQFSWNERAAQTWVRHTYEVMGQLRLISDDLDQASSGQRGYIITGERQFLAPYRANVARIGGDLDHFAAITRDNPFERHNAQVMRGLIARRLATLEQGLVLAPQIRSTSPRLLATIDAGKPAMDMLRRQIAEGLGEEAGLLRQREADRRTEEFYEAAYAGVAALLALAILLAAAIMLIRNNASLMASERSRAHEAAMLRATLDAIRDGVAFFDSAGLLCAYNDNFFRLLGFPAKLAAIQTPLGHFQAVEARRERQFLSPPDAKESDGDSTRLVLDGRELDVYRVASSSGGFVVVVADVTARVRAETMLRQTQKMESIGHLTGGVAHDFNNLLQIVSANLDLAMASPEAAAGPLSERLKNAAAAVVRGSRLTGQLLAFARRQPLDPRSTDLGRLMQDMTEMLRRTLGEQVQVESIVAGGLWNTLVDPNQVENVVLNLAINARDAMPDGGKLTIEVANAYLDDNYAGQHAEVSAGQYVMLAVSDTGAGMTPEVMARVFEPFFTTKPEGKGTGLGLAQAYGFVKQSGGHIKIYSEPGEGTTVKLYLPRTRKPREMLETANQPAPRGGSEKILVVEDDEGVRAAVVDMLGDLGYQVSQADNAERALAMLESGAAPALLFTDVVMPGAMATRDFTQRAQALCPGLPVLYTSGYTQNAIVHNGKLDEDVFLLSKPYRKDELARKIRSLLDGAHASRKKGLVLVVEDDALIRMSCVDMVEEVGFSTLEAGDGVQALALLQQNEGIEILLTDLGLPGMNGRELVTEALRLRPGLKVIVASGYSSHAEAPQENVTHLRKPFDMAQLRSALED